MVYNTPTNDAKCASRNILLVYLIIFALAGTVFLLQRRLIAFDAFSAVAIYSIIIYINRRYCVSIPSAIMTGLIFVPHLLGVLGLYSYPIFNYHMDKVIHIFTTFFASYSIMDFVAARKYFAGRIGGAFFIAVAVTMAFGSCVEISEYWGFRFIGYGEGYLGFGAGDNSQNFGPWEDSSQDQTANLAGALLGGLAMLIVLKMHSNNLNLKKKRPR
jgi:hypothetical protein